MNQYSGSVHWSNQNDPCRITWLNTVEVQYTLLVHFGSKSYSLGLEQTVGVIYPPMDF